jgi:hypothetical protein
MVYLGLILIALPFGWFLGLVAAFVLSGGGDWEQTPILTVPAGLLLGFLAALLPIGSAAARLKWMAIATAAMAAFFAVVPF